MTTTETYTRDELDRAIYRAFRMGFANSLAELDGDLQPHHHGRRRRCCTPCRVLDTAAAKLRDSRYPFSEPPTWKTLQTVEEHVRYEVTSQGAHHPWHPSHAAQDEHRAPSPPLSSPSRRYGGSGASGRDCGASVALLGVLSATAWQRHPPGGRRGNGLLGKVRSEYPCVRWRYHGRDVGTRPTPIPGKPVNRRGCITDSMTEAKAALKLCKGRSPIAHLVLRLSPFAACSRL